MNPVLILTYNCLELTKKCLSSVWNQDIPSMPYVYDNGSTDGTREMLDEMVAPGYLGYNTFKENVGVSVGWNRGLDYLFGRMRYPHVLVSNNDTILPSWLYRRLLQCKVPFVTGTSVKDMVDIAGEPPVKELVEAPDFSAFLIRRYAWEGVGPFDESMKNYYSDNDWHVRAHRAGVPLMNAGIPFYHERSSTMRHCDPIERRQLQRQFDADKKVFMDKYGCDTKDPAYAALFKD